jgi:hypothetical protein
MKGTILMVIVLGALSISGSALRLRMPRITAPAGICRMSGDALGLLATIAPKWVSGFIRPLQLIIVCLHAANSSQVKRCLFWAGQVGSGWRPFNWPKGQARKS